MKKQAIIWIIVFLVALSQALALGIRPAKTTFDFEQNVSREFKFNVINNNKEYLDVSIHAEGPLEDLIEIPENELNLSPDEEYKEISFIVRTPEPLPPGQYETKIIVQQAIPNIQVGKDYINANIYLVHKLIINVPYPEKYISAELNIEQGEEIINISANVKNTGTEDISQLKSYFSIKVNPWDKSIFEKETWETSLTHGQLQALSVIANKSALSPGEYTVASTISYDENKLELSKNFMIGEPAINLLYYDSYIRTGAINEFNFEIESNWNKRFDEVYAEVVVQKGDEDIIRQRTITFTLLPSHTSKITTYLDARKLSSGGYTIYIIFYYNGKEQKYEISPTIETQLRKTGSLLVYLIPVQITMLLAVLFITFIVINKKRKK